MKTNLHNIEIRQLQDKNVIDYYLIKDNNNNDGYFCFSKAVKVGWADLVNGWQNASQIELEYEENERGQRKVIAIVSIK